MFVPVTKRKIMFNKWFKKDKTEKNNVNIVTSDGKENGTDKPTSPLPENVITVEIQTAPAVTTAEVHAEETLSHPERLEEKSKPQPTQPPPLTYKEARSLKKARYEDIMENPRFKNSYVLLNKKTNQIVEIKASSSFHACNIIGWKANKVRVLAVNSTDKTEETSTINKT